MGGLAGDGGPASGAQLNAPTSVALDVDGNLVIADYRNGRVRRVAAGSGVITTVAGNGLGIITRVAGSGQSFGAQEGGFAGDGRPATRAELDSPSGVAVDGSGNLFLADRGNARIRKVTPATGIITTVAGTGTAGFSGDEGPRLSAQLNGPNGLAIDVHGNLYIADEDNHRIRKVAFATGIITTVAGSGPAQTSRASHVPEGGFGGDGGPATRAQLNFPSAVAVDGSGNLFIADTINHRIRKVDAGTGIITTVAGNPPPTDRLTGLTVGGFAGDGGPAARAQLNYPYDIALDASGNLFIADSENHRIRKVAGIGTGASPSITAPAEGSRLSRGSAVRVTVAWTVLAGAAQYGFEHTGPGRQFANPNGTAPDGVNGFGGDGGGFVVSGTSFTTTLAASIPAGTYQIRVIGLTTAGQVIGTFSDAVSVVIGP